MPHTNFSKYPLDIGIGIGIGISIGIGSIFSLFFQSGNHFFGEIFVSFGHFLVLFWCLGTSWDISVSFFVHLCRTQVDTTFHCFFRYPILDHFFDQKRVFFNVVFGTILWIVFLLIFHDLGRLFESFFGIFFIRFSKQRFCQK